MLILDFQTQYYFMDEWVFKSFYVFTDFYLGSFLLGGHFCGDPNRVKILICWNLECLLKRKLNKQELAVGDSKSYFLHNSKFRIKCLNKESLNIQIQLFFMCLFICFINWLDFNEFQNITLFYLKSECDNLVKSCI